MAYFARTLIKSTSVKSRLRASSSEFRYLALELARGVRMSKNTHRSH